MRTAVAHTAGPGRAPLSLPAGACDCHMHLFDTRLPFAANAVLRHGDASVDDYRALQARLGSSRCVIVQPSSYGVDHRVLTAGLHALGTAARGIAVVTPDTRPETLDRLSANGVVGARMNLVQRGATDESMLDAIAALIRPRGWHLQVHLAAPDLVRLADRLKALEVTVVIDHFARIGEAPSIAHQVEAAVFGLLATGRVWLKISAPYIASPMGPEHADLRAFVRRLAGQHLDRLVWGSDWPHVTESEKPDDAAMAGQLRDWLGHSSAITQVFVANPCALYGFGPPSGTCP